MNKKALIKLPSIGAAVIAGAIGVPLLIMGHKLIGVYTGNGILQSIWMLIAFLVPVFASTYDFEYARERRGKKRGFLGMYTNEQDFQEFYIPAWCRMIAWFIAAVVSTFLLKAVGVDFG